MKTEFTGFNLDDMDYPVDVTFFRQDRPSEPPAAQSSGAGASFYADNNRPDDVCLLLVTSGRVDAVSGHAAASVPGGCGLIFAGGSPLELGFPERAAAGERLGKRPAEGCVLRFDPVFLYGGAGGFPVSPGADGARRPAITAGSDNPWLLLDAGINGHSRIFEYARHAVSFHRDKPCGYKLAVKGALCFMWYLLLQLPDTVRASSTPESTASSQPLSAPSQPPFASSQPSSAPSQPPSAPSQPSSAPSRLPSDPEVDERLLSALPSPDWSHASPGDRERIRNALDFLEAHYTEQLSLEDIANAIPLSRSECCRCFRRSLGMSPFEYLKRYRIHMAAAKLRDSDPDAVTVSGLAASVGFNSSSYFSKAFRELMSCTPLEYKKRLN